MYGPRVFISMLGTLGVFGVSTYLMTGSFAKTFWWVLVCAVLLQVGYFIGVVLMVVSAARKKRARDINDLAKVGEKDATKSKASPSAGLNAPKQSNR